MSRLRRLLAAIWGASWWRGPLTLLYSALVLWVVLTYLEDIAPVSDWLLWDTLRLWCWQLYFCASCLSFGNWLLTRLFRLKFPLLEQAVTGMALGVVAFVLFMYLGGVLGIFGAKFAVLMPALLLACGARTSFSFFQEIRCSVRDNRRPFSLLAMVAVGFGTLGFVLLFMQSATPGSILYDAGWTHLAIAEDYAREGRIVPFISQTPKNLPHLASLLYTWDFLLPGLNVPQLRWMAALHTEFLLFIWTVASVDAAVGWMIRDTKVRGAWATFFLFPGFYVYDSNLGGAADHVAAYFAIPFFLAAVRASVAFSAPLCILAGTFAGALLHTKYQCMYLVAPVALLFVVRWIWLLGKNLWRSRRKSLTPPPAAWWRSLLLAPVGFVGATLLVFGPHLLKNWIYYKNPFYPLLLDVFPNTTPIFHDRTYDPFLRAIALEAKDGTLGRLKAALEVIVNFSYRPQYMPEGTPPLFGSLFTVLTPLVLFQYRSRRLVLGLVLTLGAMLMWAFVYRLDRNLQLLLPWIVAVTAATLFVCWRSSKIARLGLIVLVLLQAGWSVKYMIAGGESRLRELVAAAVSDLKHPSKARFDHYRKHNIDLGNSLPEDAVLLMHTHHLQLGINRRTLGDWAGYQYAIDYRPMRSAQDVYRRYKQLGITHMVWNNHDYPASIQEDVLFFEFTRHYGKKLPAVGYSLWQMPETMPEVQLPYRVLTLGLAGYADGLYAVEKLNVIEAASPERRHYPPPDRATTADHDIIQALKDANAVLMNTAFAPSTAVRGQLRRCFVQEHKHYAGPRIPGYTVHLRRENAVGCGVQPHEASPPPKSQAVGTGSTGEATPKKE